jgi:hypothetical protein
MTLNYDGSITFTPSELNVIDDALEWAAYYFEEDADWKKQAAESAAYYRAFLNELRKTSPFKQREKEPKWKPRNRQYIFVL